MRASTDTAVDPWRPRTVSAPPKAPARKRKKAGDYSLLPVDNSLGDWLASSPPLPGATSTVHPYPSPEKEASSPMEVLVASNETPVARPTEALCASNERPVVRPTEAVRAPNEGPEALFWKTGRKGAADSKLELEAEQLMASFAAEEAPNAIADALKISPSNKVFLRFSCDGTTRETRTGGKVDYSGSWFVVQVGCYFADAGDAEDGRNWPSWPDLPAHTHLTVPWERMAQKETLSSDERKAVILAEKVKMYLEALPEGTDVVSIFCGDGAEEPTNRDALILILDYVEKKLPKLNFWPHYHLCDVHSTANASDDGFNVFAALTGLNRKWFQHKYYVHGIQMKRDVQRITHNVGQQMDKCLYPVASEHVDAARSRNFALFLEDMLSSAKLKAAWQGCYPDVGTSETGEQDFAFIVPQERANAAGMKKIRLLWDRAYRNITPPQEHRWHFWFGFEIQFLLIRRGGLEVQLSHPGFWIWPSPSYEAINASRRPHPIIELAFWRSYSFATYLCYSQVYLRRFRKKSVGVYLDGIHGDGVPADHSLAPWYGGLGGAPSTNHSIVLRHQHARWLHAATARRHAVPNAVQA